MPLQRPFVERLTTTCRRYLRFSNRTLSCPLYDQRWATTRSQSLLHRRGTFQQVLLGTPPTLNPRCIEERRHSSTDGTSTITKSTLLSLLYLISVSYCILTLTSPTRLCSSLKCPCPCRVFVTCDMCCHVHVSRIVSFIILSTLDSEPAQA